MNIDCPLRACQEPNTDGIMMIDRNSIRFSPWLVEEDRIIREYIYGNYDIGFQVHITLRGNFMGVNRHIHFMLKPAVIAGDGFVAGKITLADRSVDAPFITLHSEEISGGANLLSINERESANEVIRLLKHGQDLRFMLISKQEILVELILPNDRTFEEAYNPLFNEIKRKNPIQFPS